MWVSGRSSERRARTRFPFPTWRSRRASTGSTRSRGQLHAVPQRRFPGRFTASAGTFYDGTRVGLSAGPVWNVSRHLELGMAYSINRIDFPSATWPPTTHLAQLKVELALDTHLSLSTYTSTTAWTTSPASTRAFGITSAKAPTSGSYIARAFTRSGRKHDSAHPAVVGTGVFGEVFENAFVVAALGGRGSNAHS